MRKNTRNDLMKSVKNARKAFASGKLSSYRPIKDSGVNGVQSTCAASWGPQMRR